MNVGKKLTYWGSALAVFGVVGLSALATGQTAPALEPVQQVSQLSFDNSHPSLAFSADGRQLVVVWDGIAGGNRRIFLRERLEGEWLPPVIVDANPAGDNSLPSVVLDAAGVPHVTWISQVGGRRQPVYARRISRFPNVWNQQVVPFPEDSTVTGGCDQANLKLDNNGQPWIVWQYGFGSVYSIACSRFNGNGKLFSEELTPGATSHNLYPELFFLPQPTVYWYLAQSDQFYLIGAQLDAATSRWQVALPENFENVPAQTFPDLFVTARGPLAAIWYDRLAGDAQGESRDQVFMGIATPETGGRGEAVAQKADANNHSVSAAIMGDQLLATWVSEQYETGTELYLGMGRSPGEIKSVPVRQSPDAELGNPRVTAVQGKAAVAWEEDSGPAHVSSDIMIRVADLD